MKGAELIRSSARASTLDWRTPLSLVRALGSFDLDPCGAPDHPTARDLFVLPADGLNSAWEGRVWLNPPYGITAPPWLSKFSRHGNGTALVFARTETLWFQRLIARSSASLFLADRVHFLRKGLKSDRAPAPSVLVAYGEYDAYKLRASGLRGVLYGPPALCQL
jgi:hypothetical protein